MVDPPATAGGTDLFQEHVPPLRQSYAVCKRGVRLLIAIMDQHSNSKSQALDPQFAIWKAVITGWLVVNVPVIVIMAGVLLIGMVL